MNVEEKFDSLLEKSKAVTLSEDEKQKIKSYLLDFVVKNPVASHVAPPVSWYTVFMNSVASRPAFKYATYSFGVLLVLIFAGVGVTATAQNALPGDLLYPIKTGVTEKVVAWTKLGNHAKTEYDLSLVQTRLEEIEAVSAKDELDAFASTNVRQLLNNHIADLNARVKKNSKDDQPNSVETDSRLEASLNAHAKVLGLISTDRRTNAKVKDNVSSIVSDLEEKANKAVEDRQSNESALSARVDAKTQKIVLAKINAVNKDLEVVVALIEKKKSAILPATYTRAQNDIINARGAIAQAEANIGAKKYGNAFVILQAADSSLLQAQIYVSNEAKLKLNDYIRGQVKGEQDIDEQAGENTSSRQDESRDIINTNGGIHLNIK